MNKGSVLFKQVTAVIGEEKAVIELDRVPDRNIFWGCGLSGSFSWALTPQGHSFWHSIHMGMNPYEQ